MNNIQENAMNPTPKDIRIGTLINLGYDKDVYIVSAYPRGDNTRAGLVLTSLSTGTVFSMPPMLAEFDEETHQLYAYLPEFYHYIKREHNHRDAFRFVNSVTLTVD
jgi:hypothetical protein